MRCVCVCSSMLLPVLTLFVCYRLQKECVHLEQWLKTAEEEAEQEENLSHLQEEADQHR